jgi:integrase
MAAKRVKTPTPGVYKRGGRYVAIYRDAEGRQREESAGTLDEARRLKRGRSAAVDSGEFHAASRVKLRDYAEEWIERYQGRGRRGFRESTREDYRRDLRRYVLPYFDGKLRRRVEQVTPRDIAAFVSWLCDADEQGRRVAVEKRETMAKRDGVAPNTLPLESRPVHLADATVRRILSPLRACLSSALAEGLIRTNPTVGVALPARDEQRAIDEGTDVDEQDIKALTTVELGAFLLVCPERWQTFFRLLSATGLRVSEAFALRWRDFDFDGSDPQLRVRRAYVRGRFGPPKSKYGKRSIPIDHALVVELRGRREAAEWSDDDNLVFPASNGEPLRQENVRRRVLDPTAQEAGVPWAGFHAFRHTCATRLFAAGRNAVQVQRWLGHHSPAFTLATYVHLLDDDLGGPLSSTTQASTSAADDQRTVAALELAA